jgi:hypothetical protein
MFRPALLQLTTNFSVVIPERSTSATVRLIGTLGGDTRTAPLTVERLRINSMDVAGYLAYDTTSSSFRVYLNVDAPAGGAVVALSTPHPSLISVPPSVTIPAGALSAVFSVTAHRSNGGRGGAH